MRLHELHKLLGCNATVPCPNISSDTMAAITEFLFAGNTQIKNIHVRVLLPLCTIGCVTNLVAACFIARSSLHRSGGVRVFLLSLCVFDCLQLVFTCHMIIPDLCDHWTSYGATTTPWLCGIYYRIWRLPLAHISAVIDTAHMWLIVALTAHRFWKISQPFHAHVHDTEQMACWLIAFISIAAVMFRIPILFEYDFTTKNGNWVVRQTELINNETYRTAYHLVATTLLFNIVPFVTLTLLNFMILRTLWTARHAVRKDAVNRHREQRASIAICTIVTLFLAFHSLFVYELVRKLCGHEINATDKLISTISTVLAALSASLNPLIYVAMGTGCRMCHMRVMNSIRTQRTARKRAYSSPDRLQNGVDATEGLLTGRNGQTKQTYNFTMTPPPKSVDRLVSHPLSYRSADVHVHTDVSARDSAITSL